ncbi:MAG: hypothetical protein HZC22_18005 [Rhodocyclales bacterium]|nr:hypothetical protein [Rhodocyclales bacterium]
MLGWPLAGQAIGLGKLAGEAIIGEGLQLEIPLTGSIDRPLGSECVSVRRSPDAVDPEYFPRDLVARIDSQTGAARIVLTSRAAMRQPLVEFRIFVSCGYNLVHDYVLMPAPRSESAPVVVQPAAAPAVAAPPVAAGRRLPDGIAGRNIVVARDTTLAQLARQHFPGPLRQQRFMRWVAEANPQYLAGPQATQRIAAGTSLTIPATVPPRRPGDHQNSATPPAGKDRLVVGSGGSSARNLKQAVALIDQLTGMLEKQVAAQAAYSEKIQQLETVAGELGRQIKTLEAEAAKREARWQVERQAEKLAREQEAERAWWNLLAATLAGGMVGGGLLFALGRLFGRRQAGDDVIELHPDAAEAGAEPEPMPVAAAPAVKAPKAGPLTEFGWDDDSHHLPAAPQPQPRRIDFELPIDIGAAARQEPGDPANAAIELANIMTSMGLTESAAQTLVEHIRENPRESLPQWLKLLEIHRLSGNRSEFERSATELKQHFNVQPDEWNAPPAAGRNSLEAYPHIRSQVVKLWRKPECVTLLRSLLLDNREGTRLGFPAAVADEILLLVAILNSSR